MPQRETKGMLVFFSDHDKGVNPPCERQGGNHLSDQWWALERVLNLGVVRVPHQMVNQLDFRVNERVETCERHVRMEEHPLMYQ